MSDEDALSRRERRRAAAGAAEPTEPSEIKDRNQRLRAEVEGKRKSKERERYDRVADGLAASEVMDDALSRGAEATGKFMRSNFAWLQWIIVGGIAASMGILIYDYRQSKVREKAGDELALAFSTAAGRIASADAETPTDPNLVDTRPEYSSTAEREKAALEKFRALEGSPSAELSFLGKLGRAGVLFDAGKFADARGIYAEAVGSGVANANDDWKARALEGLALSLEGEKKYDEALKKLDQLAGLGVPEMKNLARYHRGRILLLQGDKEASKKVLVELRDELKKAAPAPENPMDAFGGPRTYLARSVEELLRNVAPEAIEKNDLQAQLEALKKAMAAGAGMPSPPQGSPAPQGPSAPQGSSAPQGPSAPQGSPATPPETEIPSEPNPWAPGEGNP